MPGMQLQYEAVFFLIYEAVYSNIFGKTNLINVVVNARNTFDKWKQSVAINCNQESLMSCQDPDYKYNANTNHANIDTRETVFQIQI